MSQKRRSTFTSRASIFASPVGSSIVPKKKKGRENFLPAIPFMNESVRNSPEKETIQESSEAWRQIIDAQPKLPSLHLQQVTVDFENEVEPMEVDTSILPSPTRNSLLHGNVQHAMTATPRRKSMPTPGKRLCFTSKETENEQRKANDTTQLELFMAYNPEEMPSSMRNMIKDRKEMSKYADLLKREIKELGEIKQSSEKLLKKAIETTSNSFISSDVPVQMPSLDFSIRKEETPFEVVSRLHGNFLSKTVEAGLQKVALKKTQAEEEKNQILKFHLNNLEKAKKRKKEYDAELYKLYQQEYDELKKFSKKIDTVDNLMENFRSIPMLF